MRYLSIVNIGIKKYGRGVVCHRLKTVLKRFGDQGKRRQVQGLRFKEKTYTQTLTRLPSEAGTAKFENVEYRIMNAECRRKDKNTFIIRNSMFDIHYSFFIIKERIHPCDTW